MTEATNDPQPLQLRIFEVQFDADNPDHALVLQGLTAFLQAYGIPLRETTTIEGGITPLPKERLLSVSEELFGNDEYGRNALSFIGVYENIYNAFCIAPSKSPEGRPRLPYRYKDQPYNVTLWQVVRASQDTTPTGIDLHRYVRGLLVESCPPFTIKTERVAENSVSYAPGVITQETLQAFIERRGLQEHELHGALGKTLNTLRRAAGLAISQNALELDIPGLDFITSADLHQTISDHLPHPDVRNKIFSKINQALQHQLVTGKPTKTGEVIVEGRFTLTAPPYDATDGSWTMEYDRIARQTLSAIADSYNRETDATALLRDLAAA